jgi:hypothetical protein
MCRLSLHALVEVIVLCPPALGLDESFGAIFFVSATLGGGDVIDEIWQEHRRGREL